MSEFVRNCPSSRDLARFCVGLQPEWSSDEIASHLDDCPDCLATVDRVTGDTSNRGLRLRDCGFLFAREPEFVRIAESGSWRSSESRASEFDSIDNCPERIGRYRVDRVIGTGAFGIVYLAADEQLDRPVAIKVPHARLITTAADADAYLAEARAVGGLEHPNIVPVYDAGSTEAVPCYVVSKYIDGTDLAARQKQTRLTHRQTAELIATLADTLHYVHQQGLAHRDVKPGNILVDQQDRPFLVDFGLALRDGDVGRGPRYAGTANYMSPEQARGEGHRVDGRADIFSLAVVMYELLAGQRPFRGDTVAELLEQVVHHDPKPLPQYDDRIPRELDRICGKALAKRATDRYSTAQDFADDLRYFLTVQPTRLCAESSLLGERISIPATLLSSSREEAGIGVIPKGLRSFDSHDSEFFLQLLPGPVACDGLPDAIRFWKNRIEETGVDSTFPIGLIYGPSGCGKSSFVKAGLLPCLSNDVAVVYVEATPIGTVARILQRLQVAFPELQSTSTLCEALTSLRRSAKTNVRRKVLLVVDQFEQWLHSTNRDRYEELVSALRQCDGTRVQCLLMVRDDFWMAATSFMHDLEVRLVEGHNLAAVDLFPIHHAEKVLVAFGRAFGALPGGMQPLSIEQQKFITQAVESLAVDGKVICVRLSLFAEMMKTQSWTIDSLHRMGGTDAVGVKFLEDTFNAPAASPEHRYHQHAARRVLQALLPPAGSDIKGQMKSRSELLAASGYENGRDFNNLLAALDCELRLITPADPMGAEHDAQGADSGSRDISVTTDVGSPEVRYYQLTHDYLVPSLRDWLTRKQQETRRGRAELRLAKCTEIWSRTADTRHLPSFWEWCVIRFFTRRGTWSRPQQQMMARASHYHGRRTALIFLALLTVGFGSKFWLDAKDKQNRLRRANALVTAVVTAPPAAVPYATARLESLKTESTPLLRDVFESSDSTPQQRLHAALALARFGEPDYAYFAQSIADADREECVNVIAALATGNQQSRQAIAAQSSIADRRKDWRFRARLAITALYLKDASPSVDVCRQRSDPVQRTTFIETFEQWNAGIDRLVGVAAQIDDADLRSAMCLALGRINLDRIGTQVRGVWIPVLKDWYRHQPDAVTHSTSGWALRQWNVELPSVTTDTTGEREWNVNEMGMTMIRIKPGTFVRQESSVHEQTGVANRPPQYVAPQRVELTTPLLVSDREVTRALFLQFIHDPNWPADQKPRDWVGSPVQEGKDAEWPVRKLTWYHAVMFCNWLSKQEDLTPCYHGAGETWGVSPYANGYRLPTEAEYEYLCRAGTVTKYSFGDDAAILSRYAVIGVNDPAVVASRSPNGWGLFDMHGNMAEWCYDWHGPYGRSETVVDPWGPRRTVDENRMLRGGSFVHGVREPRSGHRSPHPAWEAHDHVGMRVVRSAGAADQRPQYGKQVSEPPPEVTDLNSKRVVGLNARWLYTEANGQHAWDEIRVGDFDGDGRSDIFTATGQIWQVSYAAQSDWSTIAQATELCPELVLGDFNGDGCTDVMKSDGTSWLVRYAPEWNTWQTLKSSTFPLRHIRVGDFDGDGRTDAFRASGAPESVWEVSYGCSDNWAVVKRSDYVLDELAFGDFDGDGITDVLGTAPLEHPYFSYLIWYSARGPEVKCHTSSYQVRRLRFGDFNANGTTDSWIAPNRSSQYFEAATGQAINADPMITRTDAITFGDFDGDGMTDPLMVDHNRGRWMISRKAEGPSVAVEAVALPGWKPRN